MTPSLEGYAIQCVRFLVPLVAMLAVIHLLVRDRRAKLDALAQLQTADRRKAKFLAVLAHELRNPLAALRTGVELLRRQHRDAPGSETLVILERQIAHMNRLIEDLLEVARIDQGKIDLLQAAACVSDIVNDAVAMTRASSDAKNQRITLALPAHEVHLRVDATRITQALGNLLHNASKFSPEGARIDLEVRASVEGVSWRVTDTGTGIAAQELNAIFDSFVQLEQGGQTQIGLGLGLTLVRRLVALHGGTVKVSSGGRGQGSVFEIILPPSCLVAERPAAPTAPASAGSVQANAALSILVVEDNHDAATTLAMLLQMDGHQVTTVTSGAQGLSTARRHRPDLAIVDIGLPDMGGEELARRLRRQTQGQAPILIALSGWALDLQQLDEASFDAQLTKPVGYDVLTTTIRELLRARAAEAA
jgi:CheY-like chemotaxis protein